MNGWQDSARAWIEFVDKGDPNRVYVVDPAIDRLCGDTSNLVTLDVGCGEGRLVRKLSERSRIAVGMEPAQTLASEAYQRGSKVVRATAEQLPFQSESIDLVTSVMSLIDIEDYRGSIAEMARVLRPGGRIVVANLSSVATANEWEWTVNEDGSRDGLILKRYFEDRADEVSWSGIKVINFHRPLTNYMSPFLRAKLTLTAFEELQPSLEAVAAHPRLADQLKVPLFCVMAWQKSITRP